MRQRFAWVALTACLLAGCGGQVRTPGDATATPAAVGTPTLTSPSPTPNTSTTTTTSVTQKYLTTARQAFPGKDDAALVQRAQSICTAVRASASTHDTVGVLAGELANQSTAQQLVTEAMAAYCPDAVKR